jgi:hypothetical protein
MKYELDQQVGLLCRNWNWGRRDLPSFPFSQIQNCGKKGVLFLLKVRICNVLYSLWVLVSTEHSPGSGSAFRAKAVARFKNLASGSRVERLDYMLSNAKCRYLKRFTCKGTLRQVFYLSEALPSYDPIPPPLYTMYIVHVTRVYSILIHTLGGGGGGGGKFGGGFVAQI